MRVRIHALVPGSALIRSHVHRSHVNRAYGAATVTLGERVSALSEPLSQRELEVLRLITQGLSNREIGERLVLALDTVKGHNRRIFGKLQVQRRTEALARARELGLS